MDEFLRLYERGANPELLKEHKLGVEAWKNAYYKKDLKGGRSPSQKEWAETYFSDIAELQRRYSEVVQNLE